MTKQIRDLSVLLSDCYKFSHRKLYPEGTTYVYSTLTPRANSYFPYDNKMVVFGYEMFVQKWLVEHFQENFFDLPIKEVLADYKYIVGTSLGEDNADADHIEALHSLGYLPIRIKALPEGTRVPMGVPVLTIENTHDDFAWLTNFLETLLISETFVTATVASMAREMKKAALKYSSQTCDNDLHVPYQCHDFSERGQHGNGAAQLSGIGHLTSFVGSDTIQAAVMAHNYYGANLQAENILKSVVASEHSVMQSYTKEHEYHTYQELINRFPEGILSLVSDTWDYYGVLTGVLPFLKNEIMARDGKLVIRPDSGNPIDVIAGLEMFDMSNYNFDFDKDSRMPQNARSEFMDLAHKTETRPSELIIKHNGAYYLATNSYLGASRTMSQPFVLTPHPTTVEEKGSLELLWETFGGTVNGKGYRELDSHIGLLYGEGITVENMNAIFARMARKGFASSNVVFGVGAYVYSVQVSRDSFAQAIKSQMCIVNGEERQTFKDPKGNSIKKSLKGKVAVIVEDDWSQPNYGEFIAVDGLSTVMHKAFEEYDELQTIFENGIRTKHTPFSTIRDRIDYSLEGDK